MDPSDEFIKAVIGSAVNIALPGAGSVVAIGFDALTAKSLNQSLAHSLSEAINTVDDSADVPKLALIRRGKGRWRKHKVNKALKGSVTFSKLRSTSIERFNNAVGDVGDEASIPSEPAESDNCGESAEQLERSRDLTSRDLTRLAFVQLSLARTEGPLPGTWQDDFEDHLEILARMGLSDATHGSVWRQVITGESDAMPSPARVEEWARLVTEAFAVQLAGDTTLAPYLAQLTQQDERASERAFLWQLDHQRRAIHLVAFVLLAIAVEYGVHLAT